MTDPTPSRRSTPAFASPPLTELDRAILHNRRLHDAAQTHTYSSSDSAANVVPLLEALEAGWPAHARWQAQHQAEWEAEVQAELDAADAEHRAQRWRINKLLLALTVIALATTAGLYVLHHGLTWPALRAAVFGILAAYPT